MTSQTVGDGLDLALAHALLGVDDEEDGRELVSVARTRSGTLPQLVISLARRAGLTLGSGSRDELARARRRAERYAELYAALPAEAAARVVKGPSIARHYPADLVRPVGDLDLVVPGEAELWHAARLLVRTYGAEQNELTVLTANGRRHLVVVVSWPAADPLLEPELRVELSTAALVGDLRTVPVRAVLPESPELGDLLTVAEERFQRPFHLKDAVDAIVLLGSGALPPAAEVAAAFETYCLAPEGAELLRLARTPATGDMVDCLLASLEEPARRELARRSSVVPRPEPTDPQERLAAGFPVWGMLLDGNGHRTGPDRLTLTEDGGLVAHTPVGSFLMVGGDLVRTEEYEAALTALAGQGRS
ncbi:hypothetical protein ACFV2H_11035 [Streptomyces sp. NPDC059629]|uniref:hypothetical protein n=1 Tax=Streptomyces sp. NPDC059629 TaxID=3346889 RepID=UPI0036CFB85B